MHDAISLVDCLKLFNRKERYWLLRNALGRGAESELPLEEKFLHRVLEAAKIAERPAPSEVWWAMDYHLDWLAGALRLFGKQHIRGMESRKLDPHKKAIISGTQEDIDFVIAFARHIVLIEAKGVTSWNSAQYDSKVARFRVLKDLIRQYGCPDVHIELMLMSPKDSDRLQHDRPHLELLIPGDGIASNATLLCGPNRFLKTTRCTEQGAAKDDGKHWKIDPVN